MGVKLAFPVDLDDVVTVGGPDLDGVASIVPLLKEISDLGGDEYHALLVVYRRGANVDDAQRFRDGVMAVKNGEGNKND